MVERRFGPTRAAGVVIREREGPKPITPAARGFCAWAGVTKKGSTTEPIICFSDKDFLQKCGGIISDSFLPDAALDFFSVARGAGGLVIARAVDGNQKAAEQTIFGRRTKQTIIGTIKAKNGGRWGGKRRILAGTIASSAALVANTIATGLTMIKDEWKDATLELNFGTPKTYHVVGNTIAGVVSVDSDQNLLTDAAGAVYPLRWYLTLENEGFGLAVEWRDGEDRPDTEFGLFVFEDGIPVFSKPNLSLDPTSARYWVAVVNDDTGNEWVELTDLITGARPADLRPANHFGTSSALTPTLLTTVPMDFTLAMASVNATPTVTLGTTTDTNRAQTLTATFTSATAFNVVSSLFGAIGAGTTGVEFVAASTNKYVPPFTVSADVDILSGDIVTIQYKPFTAGELVGGFIFPDTVGDKRVKFRITANTHKTISVSPGQDMTTAGTTGDKFLVQAPRFMEDGRDGVAGVGDPTFQAIWDPANSPFNKVLDLDLGLLRCAIPGNTSSVAQKAGIQYAEAKGMQYRYEVPSGTVDEVGADTFVNETLGRNDFAKVSFPSFGFVQAPGEPTGKLKLVTLTGKIQGREAATARDFDGYHKPAAGEAATLPGVVKLTTGAKVLNEEFLNPRGFQIIKKVKGNFIIWGDRGPVLDPQWTFTHKRELISEYEIILRTSQGFIIFSINEPSARSLVVLALRSFFFNEYKKKALDNNLSFEEAFVIKSDVENNPQAVRAAGDAVVELTLALSDVIERLIISISQAGVSTRTA